MADTKITDLAAITSGVASTDVTVLVDVSDTSMAASGTDKKITVGDLATAIASAGSLATDTEVASAISALSSVYQPLDSDLTAIAALSTTSFGRGLLVLADASAGRTALGLVIGSDVAAQSSLASYQPLDSDLTAIAALTTTSFGRSLLALADAAAGRTALGLVIGTDVQAQDAELAAIAGLTSAADRLPYFTGSGTAALATFTAAGRALVDDADASAQRTTLGLAAIAASGSASDLSTGTVATARLGSGTADGTTFLRGDQTWATPAGGSNVPLRVLPAVGQWIGPAASAFSVQSASSSASSAHNRLITSVLYVDVSVTIDQLSIEVTTAADASSVIRLGLWSDSGSGRPGTLLEQGTVAADSTGAKALALGSSRLLTPGLYWVGHAWQSGVPTTQPAYRAWSVASGLYAHGYGADTGNTPNGISFLLDGVSGSFSSSPSMTASAGGTGAGSPARILLRVA